MKTGKIAIKLFLYLFIFLVCFARSSYCDYAEPGGSADDFVISDLSDDSSLPSADIILEHARAHIIPEPMLITGELVSKGKLSRVTEDLKIKVEARQDGDNAVICYTINDRFGGHLESLEIVRNRDKLLKTSYFTGPEMKESELPEITSHIRKTDLTWNDLSLNFLWWRTVKPPELDRFIGRRCYKLTMAPDMSDKHESLETSVTVWVDTELCGFLAADFFNSDGVRTRRMRVRSLKKINDLWMVKDMSFTSFPLKYRTVIKIDDMELLPTGDKNSGDD